jgi:transposase
MSILRKAYERRTWPFDRGIYCTRNQIERLVDRFKQFRHLATRYEKRAENYRAMWLIAASLVWLKVIL